jgi:ABC-2 type transport system permease protein
MTLTMMLSWAAAAIVMSRLVNVELGEQLSERIRRGDILFEIMRPTDFQPQAFGSWLGSSLYKLLVDTLPMALVLWGIAGISGAPSLSTLIVAACSLGFAMIIAFLLHFSVILIGFWTIQVRTWTWLLDRVVQLTAGFFVPLWLLPEGLQSVLQYLPFAMLYHVPLSIFVGRVQGQETVQLLLIQMAWIPALLILGRVMMRQARRRVLVQGG